MHRPLFRLIGLRVPRWLPGADVVVMDDGFQNGNAERYFNSGGDGVYGFGNGRVMPAGPLRETLPGGLARADMIVVLGGNVSSIEGVSPPTYQFSWPS